MKVMYGNSCHKTFLTRTLFIEKQYKTSSSEKWGQRPNLLLVLCHEETGYQDKRGSYSDVLCFTPLMLSKHFTPFL